MKWLALWVAFLVSMPLLAATYYVDFAAGSDANNGTSTSTPFKHVPGDTNCTDTADSTTLSAGDVVKFKGGIVYTGNVSIAWSGASGNPITYDGNHSGDWGTGRAIIDAAYTLNGACLYAGSGRSFITVKGFTLQNAGGWADDHADVLAAAAGTQTNSVNTGGVGVDMFTSGNHTNIYFDNLYMHRMGGWRNTMGWTSGTINGGGITMKSGVNITVTNCEFTKMKSAIGIFANPHTHDVEIVDCNIHNYITWGVDVAPIVNNGVLRDITIHRNEIHDYSEFNAGNWEGANVGGSEHPHTDGIFLRNSGMTGYTWDNVRIHSNEWYCDDPGDSEGGTGCIFISEGPSALIYNNVFNDDPHTRIIGVGWHNQLGTNQVWIFNNTFAASPACILQAGETNAQRRQVYILNNIFRKVAGNAANNSMLTSLDGTLPTVVDYNLYYDETYGELSKYVFVGTGGDYTRMTNMFNGWGYEEHGDFADPLFVNYAATPVSTRDFRLQSGSPAIGAGTNLSAFFTTDKNGVARGSVWDIGAYEYQAEPQPTTLNVNTLTVQGQAVFGP